MDPNVERSLRNLRTALTTVATDLEALENNVRRQQQSAESQLIAVCFPGVPRRYTYRYDDRQWDGFAQVGDYVAVYSPRTSQWEIVQVVAIENVPIPPRGVVTKEAFPINWRHPESGRLKYGRWGVQD